MEHVNAEDYHTCIQTNQGELEVAQQVSLNKTSRKGSVHGW
jgi:hypothetical protein